MASKKQVLAAAMLAAIAITAIAYATITTNSFGISAESVTVKLNTFTLKIPAPGGAYTTDRTGDDALKITFPSALASQTVRLRAELVVDGELYQKLRALTVKVGPVNSPKAILTLNNPWDEFTDSVPSASPYTLSYDVRVIAAAGADGVDGTVMLRVVPVGGGTVS